MANNDIRFKIGFDYDKSSLDQLHKDLKRIQKEAEGKNPESNLTKGLVEAGEAAKKLEGILNKSWNSSLDQLDLTKFNTQVSQTKGGLTEIIQKLGKAGYEGQTAINNLQRSFSHANVEIKESNKLLNDMAKTMSNTVRWGITSTIFNSITNSIQHAYNYTKRLDTSLNDIRIVTDKSAESMEKFAKQANTAAKELGKSTLDYTKASLIYYQQGLSDEETKARSETTLKAANVTGQTGEEVSEQLTAVWNGYKVSAAETEKYVDKLSAVAASTASDLEELSTGMSKVASAANSMGVDVDKLNGMLSTVISVTRQAPESAGTAFKTIFARMGDLELGKTDEEGVGLGEVSSSLEQMGVHILDAQGKMKDMGDVIQEVGDKWNSGAWSDAEKQALAIDLAGKRQYNNLLALFDNWEMYNQAVQTSINSTGTLNEQNEIYLESTAAHVQQLRTEFEKTYDIIFDQDAVNFLIDALNQAVVVLNTFLNSMGGGLGTMAGLGAITAKVFKSQIGEGINKKVQTIQKEKDATENTLKVQEQLNKAEKEQGEILAKNIELQKKYEETKKIYIENPSSENEKNLNKAKNNLASSNRGLKAKTENKYGSIYIDSATAEASAKAKKLELDISKDIENVTKNLSQEEYNTLKEEQKKLGVLQQEYTYYEKMANWHSDDLKMDFSDKSAGEVDDYKRVLEQENKKTFALLKGFKENDSFLKSTTQDGEKIATGTFNNNALEHFKNISINTKEQTKNVERIIELNKKNNLTLEEQKEYQNRINLMIDSQNDNLEKQRNLVGVLKEVSKAKHEQLEGQDERKQNIDYGKAAIHKKTEGIAQAQSISAAVNGISNAVMGISMITGSFKVIGDETMSLGEKISSLSMSLIIAGPMIQEFISDLPNMGKGFKVIGETIQNAALPKVNKLKNHFDKLSKSGSVLGKVLGALGKGLGLLMAHPAVAFIGAISIGLVLLIKHFTSLEVKINKANKKVSDLQKELGEANSATQNLQSTLSQLKDSQNAIKGMAKGTQEYTAAVMQSNQAVLELIASHKNLAQYLITDEQTGMLTISEEGQEKAMEQQLAYASAINMEYMSASISAQKMQDVKNIKDFSSDSENRKFEYEYTKDKPVTETISKSESERGIQLLAKYLKEDNHSTKDISKDKDDEAIAKMLGMASKTKNGTEYISEENKKLASAISQNITQYGEMATALNNSKLAQEKLTQAYVDAAYKLTHPDSNGAPVSTEDKVEKAIIKNEIESAPESPYGPQGLARIYNLDLHNDNKEKQGNTYKVDEEGLQTQLMNDYIETFGKEIKKVWGGYKVQQEDGDYGKTISEEDIIAKIGEVKGAEIVANQAENEADPIVDWMEQNLNGNAIAEAVLASGGKDGAFNFDVLKTGMSQAMAEQYITRDENGEVDDFDRASIEDILPKSIMQDEEMKAYLQDMGIQTYNDLVEAFGQGMMDRAKMQDYAAFSTEEIDNMQTGAENITAKLASGELNSETAGTDQDFKAMVEDAERLAQVFPELRDEAAAFSEEGMVGTEIWQVAFNTLQDKINAIETAQLLDQLHEVEAASTKLFTADGKDKETGKIKYNVEFDIDNPDDIQQLQDYLSADHKLNVEIVAQDKQLMTNLQNHINSIQSAFSKISSSGKIAEKDILAVNRAIPGAAAGIKRLSNGVYQLNNQTVKQARTAAQKSIQIEKDAVANKLKADADALRKKGNSYIAIGKAFQKYAQTEVKTTKAKNKLNNTIEKEAGNIRNQNKIIEVANNQKIDASGVEASKKNGEASVANWNAVFAKITEGWEKLTDKAAKAQAAMAKGKSTSLGWEDISVSNFTDGDSTVDSVDLDDFEDILDTGTDQDIANLGIQYVAMGYGLLNQAKTLLGDADYAKVYKPSDATTPNNSDGNGNNGNRKGNNGNKKGNDGSKNSGSEAEKGETQEFIKERVDQYLVLNNLIKDISNNLKQLEIQQKRAFGKKQIDILKDQNKLLIKQNKLYGQLADRYVKQALGIRKTLIKNFSFKDKGKKYSLKFDKNGQISNNYMRIFNLLKKDYNNYVKDYNKKTKKQQEKDKKTLEEKKQRFEQYKQLIEQYNKIINEDLPNAKEQYQANLDKLVENNIKKIDLEIKLYVDTEELKKKLDKFKLEFVLKVDMNSAVGKGQVAYENLKTNLTSSQLNFYKQEMISITREIEKMKANNQYQSKFGKGAEGIKAATETLTKMSDNTIKILTDIKKNQEDVKKAYIQSLDDVKKAFSDLGKDFKAQDDIYKTQEDIFKLFHSEENFDARKAILTAEKTSKEEQAKIWTEAANYWKEIGATEEKYLPTEEKQEQKENAMKYEERKQENKRSIAQFVDVKKAYQNTVEKNQPKITRLSNENGVINSILKKINTRKGKTIDLSKGEKNYLKNLKSNKDIKLTKVQKGIIDKLIGGKKVSKKEYENISKVLRTDRKNNTDKISKSLRENQKKRNAIKATEEDITKDMTDRQKNIFYNSQKKYAEESKANKEKKIKEGQDLVKIFNSKNRLQGMFFNKDNKGKKVKDLKLTQAEKIRFGLKDNMTMQQAQAQMKKIKTVGDLNLSKANKNKVKDLGVNLNTTIKNATTQVVNSNRALARENKELGERIDRYSAEIKKINDKEKPTKEELEEKAFLEEKIKSEKNFIETLGKESKDKKIKDIKGLTDEEKKELEKLGITVETTVEDAKNKIQTQLKEDEETLHQTILSGITDSPIEYQNALKEEKNRLSTARKEKEDLSEAISTALVKNQETTFKDLTEEQQKTLEKYGFKEENALKDIKESLDASIVKDTETLVDIEQKISDNQKNVEEESADKEKEDFDAFSDALVKYEDALALVKQDPTSTTALAELKKAEEDLFTTLGEGDPEIVEKAYENHIAMLKDAKQAMIDAAKKEVEIFKNDVNKILFDFQQSLTTFGGKTRSFDNIKEEYDLIKKEKSFYLDDIDASYEKQKLKNKWLDAIDKDTSVENQKELNKLMQQQMDMLEKKDKLSKYDLERAEKQFNLTVKKLALEEAQRNKSQLKLRRDANGNLTYQYVADQKEIRKAQQAYDDAKHSLYQTDKKAYEKNTQDYLKLQSEFKQKIFEVYDKFKDDEDTEKRNDAIKILKEHYVPMLDNLAKDNQNIVANLKESILVSNPEMSAQEVDSILKEIFGVENGVQNMITNHLSGNFAEKVDKIFSSLDTRLNIHQNTMAGYETAIKDLDDQMSTALDHQKEAHILNIEKMKEEEEKMKDIRTQTDLIVKIFSIFTDSISILTGVTLDFLHKMSEAEIIAGKIDKLYEKARTLVANIETKQSSSKGKSEKKTSPKGFDTGGYTGDWSGEGRMAMLHQKELVLNKEDTANMLKSIELLRDISGIIKTKAVNRIKELTPKVIEKESLSPIINNNTDNSIQQTVNITANFEGKTEATQIQTALNNLVNVASQRANRNIK